MKEKKRKEKVSRFYIYEFTVAASLVIIFCTIMKMSYTSS